MGVYTLSLKETFDHCERMGWDNGLHDYPIFDESHREVLNTKIVNRYLNREIAFETPEMFTHYLRTRMHEIMPLFNERYRTTLITFDPLRTTDMTQDLTTDTNTDVSAAENSEATANAFSVAKVYDIPQTRMNGDEDYAAGMNDSDSDSTTGTTSDTTSTTETDYTSTSRQYGYNGAPAVLIESARNLIINVDVEIINELSDLFFGLYAVGSTNFEDGLSTW
jgi:hypothetical protein